MSILPTLGTRNLAERCRHDIRVLRPQKPPSSKTGLISINIEAFKKCIQLHLASSCLSQTSLETSTEDWRKSIIAALDTYAPLKSIKISSQQKPWTTPEIRKVMVQRDKAYKSATQSGISSVIERFRAQRGRVCNVLNIAKNNYYTHK
ncbi:hypothetical protein TSAR_006995 [Trichomalopsis sarcophagae]|uniref:Uncharacterized protein n=1 Tax=Trichomalopsis sarcophagae TaxID=543379 RepID=A0A232EWL4_9HYME|nr:hypothetical protein TSAR_006995 [Trichomalopsis sarcophagae]